MWEILSFMKKDENEMTLRSNQSNIKIFDETCKNSNVHFAVVKISQFTTNLMKRKKAKRFIFLKTISLFNL